jgi:predicted lipoprotein with Yx(FWY)xxD motif
MAETNVYPDAINPIGAWRRHIVQTYGGQDVNVAQQYWDMSGYKREMGGANFSAQSNVANPFRTGSGLTRVTPMGGGGTPSNPGGYNWGTLGSVVQTTFNAPLSMYNTYRGKQDALARKQRVASMQATRAANAQTAQQKAQSAQESQNAKDMAMQYTNMLDPNMNYSSVYAQTAAQEPQLTSQQAAQASHTYGNLMDPDTNYPSVYQQAAPKVKKTRTPSVRKPKAKRPTPPAPLNTFDPNIW